MRKALITIGWTVTVLAVCSLNVFAQSNETLVRRLCSAGQRDYETREDEKRTGYRKSDNDLKTIKELLSNLEESESPCQYRKWSNGMFSYVGKLFFENWGIIPTQSKPFGINLLYNGYKVLDLTDEGARIVPYKCRDELDYEHDVFIVGLFGVYSDRSYGDIMMTRHIGSFTYKTTSGGSRTIPKCEIGEPATKQQYVAWMTPKPVKPAQPTVKTNAPKDR